MQRVLIVGARAVGQVFGRHLQAGGAHVDVLVRPSQVEAARAGFVMYPLNRHHPRREPVRFVPDDVLDAPEAIPSDRYDQVYLCLPSPALHAEGLVAAVAAHAGEAIVTFITAAIGDRELMASHVPEERLVQAFIGLISYAAPLPGEAVPEPGTAYWFPPMVRSGVAGPDAARDAVASALEAGGLPAQSLSAMQTSGMSGAVLMPHLLALEACGWSLSTLRGSPRLAEAGAATDEARAIVAAREGLDAPGHLPPTLMWLVLAGAPWVFPFPLEAYLERHFTKVGDQTRLNVRKSIEQGRALELPTPHLEALIEAVAPQVADGPPS